MSQNGCHEILASALATFESDDENEDDIANAYAMEYASSDDEKA